MGFISGQYAYKNQYPPQRSYPNRWEDRSYPNRWEDRGPQQQQRTDDRALPQPRQPLQITSSGQNQQPPPNGYTGSTKPSVATFPLASRQYGNTNPYPREQSGFRDNQRPRAQEGYRPRWAQPNNQGQYRGPQAAYQGHEQDVCIENEEHRSYEEDGPPSLEETYAGLTTEEPHEGEHDLAYEATTEEVDANLVRGPERLKAYNYRRCSTSFQSISYIATYETVERRRPLFLSRGQATT